jgi:hypothetical protein
MAKATLAIHDGSNRPVTDQLHPTVYKLAAGLVLWFVMSAWVFFHHQGDMDLLLTVVSGLLFVAVLLPYILWRVRRGEHVADVAEAVEQRPSFRAWAFGDFETGLGRLRGLDATIDILLPLAGVAFGLMLLGLVFAISAYSFS